MADHPIHNPKDYSEVLRQLLTTDPVHADTLNPLFERLLNNDAFIKAAADKVAADLTTHAAAANPHAVYLLKSGGTMTGSITFQDLLEGVVLAAGGQLKDQATGTVINAAEGSLTVTDETGATSLFAVSNAVLKYLNNTILHSGNHNNTGDPHPQYALDTDLANYVPKTPADTRNTTKLPGAYAQGITLEFTRLVDLGIKTGTQYGLVATYKPWTDDSGGPVHQMCFSDDSTCLIWHRTGTTAAGWSFWKPIGTNKLRYYTNGAADANGKYATIDYKRTDGSLYARVVHSNPDANGNYLTVVTTYYGPDGVTALGTERVDRTFDANGVMTSEA
ncbi:hypothetical protein NST23_18640 [Brevibacillus sp. FSL K6-0770]|uniref:hypothetical protein n=1 Tax=Brevibacillus sp. FSL K6-0770 TaxID=2954673 RepID=UPI0030F65EE0